MSPLFSILADAASSVPAVPPPTAMSPLFTFLVGTAVLLMLFFYVGTAIHSTKRRIGTLLIIVATAFSVLTLKNLGIKLGIDLLGGSEFIVKLSPGRSDDGTEKAVTKESIQQAIAILEKRLNPDGQKDLLLAPEGTDRILVQMPGVKAEDVEDVRTKIQQVAHLEFRIVHNQSAAKLAEIKARGGVKEPGWDELPFQDAAKGSELVRDHADLEGKYVKRAFATYDSEGWKCVLNLDSTGAKLFDELASKNKGNQMAIIVDGKIISAPVLQTDHFGGTAVISGNAAHPFKETEVRTLASLLENPLDNPMQIMSESAVSSSYGQSSIDEGKWICIGGLLITTIIMLIFYRVAGLVAIVGLVVNLVLLFGAMSLFQFTMTMPGIAGIILTMGIAVDANVLIYERLREEQEAGKSLISALDTAYEKAFSAIADSNVTSLITAIILFIIAGGLVRGFAVTLMIGLLSSLVGALVVTRVIFMWVVDGGHLKTLTVTKVIPNHVFDIMSRARGFIIASLVLTAVSFAVLGIKGSSSFGIDFRGGSITQIELNSGKDIATQDIEGFLKGLKGPDGKSIGTAYVQRKNVGGSNVIAVRSEFDAGPVIQNAVPAKYGKEIVKGVNSERVGSIIGGEMAKTSLWALLISLVAIFIYLSLRFEWAFAVGAIVALFHDVLMVPGLCVLFGQELSVIHVGALLTIAGYSINDTIVVFDRIRETIQRGGALGDTRDMMNNAICKTLSRTILTSFVTFAPMFILIFAGNPAMVEFALPITIGIVLGTYSSIFIASPLVLWYATHTGHNIQRQIIDKQLAEQRAQAAVAAANASQQM